MDDLIKLSILDEVDIQCWLALTSFDKMKALINKQDSNQSKEVWKYLQAFLAHSGILSSLIFKEGNQNKTKIVTDYLKTELKMTEDSPIKERGGRNFLEHIEVFEIYSANRKDTKGILQMVFKNMKGFDYLDQKRWYIKRALIMDEMIFVYQNQESIKKLPLIPLQEEINRIYNESENTKSNLSSIIF